MASDEAHRFGEHFRCGGGGENGFEKTRVVARRGGRRGRGTPAILRVRSLLKHREYQRACLLIRGYLSHRKEGGHSYLRIGVVQKCLAIALKDDCSRHLWERHCERTTDRCGWMLGRPADFHDRWPTDH